MYKLLSNMNEPGFERFVTCLPSHQNAVDLFDWVSKIPVEGLKSGDMYLFYRDRDQRPQMVVDVLGSIEGFDVLELGPLEGAHSYQLDQLGAKSILAIEANPEQYLKCLIAKEILSHKVKFLLGDFNAYMEASDRMFDLIFACGMLYHMPDPIHTLYLISQHSPRTFIWTHYIDESNVGRLKAKQVQIHGFECDYYEVYYDEQSHSRGWAGVKPSANRLKKDDILRALKHFRFDNVVVTEDTPDHPGGPAFSVVAHNTRFDAGRSSAEDNASPYQEAQYYRNACLQLREQVGELNHELARLRVQTAPADATAQQRIDELLNSTSWKITAPLRQTKLFFQRLSRR